MSFLQSNPASQAVFRSLYDSIKSKVSSSPSPSDPDIPASAYYSTAGKPSQLTITRPPLINSFTVDSPSPQPITTAATTPSAAVNSRSILTAAKQRVHEHETLANAYNHKYSQPSLLPSSKRTATQLNSHLHHIPYATTMNCHTGDPTTANTTSFSNTSSPLQYPIIVPIRSLRCNNANNTAKSGHHHRSTSDLSKNCQSLAKPNHQKSYSINTSCNNSVINTTAVQLKQPQTTISHPTPFALTLKCSEDPPSPTQLVLLSSSKKTKRRSPSQSSSNFFNRSFASPVSSNRSISKPNPMPIIPKTTSNNAIPYELPDQLIHDPIKSGTAIALPANINKAEQSPPITQRMAQVNQLEQLQPSLTSIDNDKESQAVISARHRPSSDNPSIFYAQKSTDKRNSTATEQLSYAAFRRSIYKNNKTNSEKNSQLKENEAESKLVPNLKAISNHAALRFMPTNSGYLSSLNSQQFSNSIVIDGSFRKQLISFADDQYNSGEQSQHSPRQARKNAAAATDSDALMQTSASKQKLEPSARRAFYAKKILIQARRSSSSPSAQKNTRTKSASIIMANHDLSITNNAIQKKQKIYSNHRDVNVSNEHSAEKQYLRFQQLRNVSQLSLKGLEMILVVRRKSILDSIKDLNVSSIESHQWSIIDAAIATNHVAVLARILLFVGHIQLALGNMDKSAYFFNQSRISCQMLNGAYALKARVYRSLGELSLFMHQFDFAVILFKKSVQYAWEVGWKDEEIEVYKQLGIAYYYLQNMQKSAYYHQRAIEYLPESRESPIIKQASIMNKKLSQQQENDCTKIINSRVFSRLSLPIQLGNTKHNKNGQTSDQNALPQSKFHHKANKSAHVPAVMIGSTENKMNDDTEMKQWVIEGKSRIYENCAGEEIIKELMESDEFTFEIPTPKYHHFDKGIIANKQDDMLISKENLSRNDSLATVATVPYSSTTTTMTTPTTKTTIGVVSYKQSASQSERKFEDYKKYKLPLEKKIAVLTRESAMHLDEILARASHKTSQNPNSNTQHLNDPVRLTQNTPSRCATAFKSYPKIPLSKIRTLYDEILCEFS